MVQQVREKLGWLTWLVGYGLHGVVCVCVCVEVVVCNDLSWGKKTSECQMFGFVKLGCKIAWFKFLKAASLNFCFLVGLFSEHTTWFFKRKPWWLSLEFANVNFVVSTMHSDRNISSCLSWFNKCMDGVYSSGFVRQIWQRFWSALCSMLGEENKNLKFYLLTICGIFL